MSASQDQASTDNTATQDALPRVIDENTDMSTLTDQEIMRLMEGMNHNEDVMSKVRLLAYPWYERYESQ
jgi:ubiquitin thioesterase protein OTUB1